MSDKELLSEEEILALVERDESNEGEAYNLDVAAQNYDIASEDSASASYLGALKMISERFVRSFRISLESLLRYQPKVESQPVVIERFSTYMSGLNTPLSLNVVKITPLRGSTLIVIDPQLIFNSLDGFFGGSGTHAEVSGIREFTPTEVRVIQMILNCVFEDMKTAWEPVQPVSFAFLNAEVNPQLASIVDENDLVIIKKITITMAHGVVGNLQIVYPYASMDSIHEQLRNQVVGESDTDDERVWNNYLNLSLEDVYLDIKSDLAHPKISLLELRNLKVGDVIPIKMPETVAVKCQGISLFSGIYGSSNSHASVKIMSETAIDNYEKDG